MSNQDYQARPTSWCPGCGNFDILEALLEVLNQSTIPPQQLLLVGGIGQAAKIAQYVTANGFCGLHGRALANAVGAKLANQELTVIVNSGDGDSYGEGGNHFLHNIRRNVDITHLVHNNQIYGLTKGQASPTTMGCGANASPMSCNKSQPLQPLTLALAAGATFVARAFSGRKQHLAGMIRAALAHPGYALVDILQPCVSFNKLNTFAWYQERVYELDAHYDSADLQNALAHSLMTEERIPIGILYQASAPSYQAQNPALFDGTAIVKKPYRQETVEALIRSFS